MQRDLGHAIVRHELRLEYQPVVRLRDGRGRLGGGVTPMGPPDPGTDLAVTLDPVRGGIRRHRRDRGVGVGARLRRSPSLGGRDRRRAVHDGRQYLGPSDAGARVRRHGGVGAGPDRDRAESALPGDHRRSVRARRPTRARCAVAPQTIGHRRGARRFRNAGIRRYAI